MEPNADLFDRMRAYAPVWIKGNHDGDFVPPGFEGHDTYATGGIVFTHIASEKHEFEISGHYHPKIDIAYKGGLISRRCFIETSRKLILPAFGAYTGGLSIKHLAFKTILAETARVHILAEEKILSLNMHQAYKFSG